MDNKSALEKVATTAERLREALSDKNMRAGDIAKLIGVSHSSISRYLSGTMEPKQEATHRMAKVLNVSEFWLWGFNVPKVRTLEQQKNDDLVMVVSKLRKDPDFFEVVKLLASLSTEEYDSIKLLLGRLGNK